MYAQIRSGGLSGIRSYITQVEVDISRGLPAFEMVGKLGSEVKEARERVKVALNNCGITVPPTRITVNISPANIHKYGTAYDLPIAIGIMTALGEIPEEAVAHTLIIGELGLNGEIKRVPGVLPIIIAAKNSGISQCIIPYSNASEAAYVNDIDIVAVRDIYEAISSLQNAECLKEHICIHKSIEETVSNEHYDVDFADIVGQEACKRAALIAAAGFHHLLIVGPPGSGKTMLAKRMPTIMPPLSAGECLDVSTIYSVAGLLNEETPLITRRPFLSPHHTSTRQALAGGGTPVKPGAVSLSHRGVLFLDEFPEFSRECVEVLREPLEDKKIQIARANYTFEYPADFMLVAAANPCPCGHYPNRNLCNCSEQSIARYRSRISGPIKDRIDIRVTSEKVEVNALTIGHGGMSSAQMRELVMSARGMQEQRFSGSNIYYNSQIPSRLIDSYCHLARPEQEYMREVYNSMNLTARSYHKILKVARTIADLNGSDSILIPHLAEAVCYQG